MCKLKKYHGTSNTQTDKCIRGLIKSLNKHGIKTLGSCCGHGKYPMTIVYQVTDIKDVLVGNIYEFISGWGIPRKRSFYKKDEEGYYYIPEVTKKEVCECGHTQWTEHKCTFDPMVAQECNVKGCKCKKFKLRKPLE